MKLTSSDMTQGKLEKLSLAQRMLAAKKRRQEQVNQYQIREKKEDKGAHNGYNPSKKRTNSTAKVSFDPTALLFEAVIRNDLNEGGFVLLCVFVCLFLCLFVFVCVCVTLLVFV